MNQKSKDLIYDAIDELNMRKVVMWSHKKRDVQNAFNDYLLVDLVYDEIITEQEADEAYEMNEFLEYFFCRYHDSN